MCFKQVWTFLDEFMHAEGRGVWAELKRCVWLRREEETCKTRSGVSHTTCLAAAAEERRNSAVTSSGSWNRHVTSRKIWDLKIMSISCLWIHYLLSVCTCVWVCVYVYMQVMHIEWQCTSVIAVDSNKCKTSNIVKWVIFKQGVQRFLSKVHRLSTEFLYRTKDKSLS